ncbi:MAG: hypothetical protein IJS50_00630 [Desulfovibrio sp.]|nr:hypothetical protein [Desulfovibrio sp.]
MWLWSLVLLFGNLACAVQKPRDLAVQLGASYGFSERLYQSMVQTKGEILPLSLFALLRKGKGERLHVYLEGDGLAYLTPTKVSPDPTPNKPCGLWLALHDPAPNVLYLARPGQYLLAFGYPCPQRFWTKARLSSEVLLASEEAIERAKAECQAKEVVLVGFSGGGGLAALLASRRRDVVFLATCAGNLNLDCWVKSKELSPLTESLDPLQVAPLLGKIAQRHVLGSLDQIIPQSCLVAFCQAQKTALKPILVPDFAHTAPWDQVWDYNYLK